MTKINTRAILMLLTLFLLILPGRILADNEWQFSQKVLLTPGSPLAIGDSNHNGRMEFIYRVIENNQFSVRIYEYQNGSYPEVYRFNDMKFIPWIMDDVDNDDRTDLFMQCGPQYGNYLCWYESPDANSYPTQLVWSAFVGDGLNFNFKPIIGDLDNDNKKEIIISPVGVVKIYECNGNNSLQLINDSIRGSPFLISDLDRDGQNEMVVSTSVYKAKGDNQFYRAWSISIPYLSNVYSGSLLPDLNGNSYPEFVIGGTTTNDRHWRYYTFEKDPLAGIDEPNYKIIDNTIDIYTTNGAIGLTHSAAGDFDNDGQKDLVVYTGTDHYIYSWQNGWHNKAVISVPNNDYGWLSSADTNNNGFDEIIVGTGKKVGQGYDRIYEFRGNSPIPVDCR